MTALLTRPVPPILDAIGRRGFLAALGTAGLLTACATPTAAPPAAPPAAATEPFDHELGTTEVPVAPQRIVTLNAYNGMISLLELGVRPIGSTGQIRDDGTRVFPYTDGFDTSGVEFVSGFPVDIEAVVAQRPDLIVSANGLDDSYATLSAIAPTVFINSFDKPLPDALARYAELVGRQTEGAALRAAYEGKAAALVADLGERRTTMSVSVIEATEPGFFVRGDYGGAIGAAFADLDLLRPTSQQGPVSLGDDALSIETIGDHDADLMIVFDFSSNGLESGTEFAAQPTVQATAAARAGQVVVVPGSPVVGSAWRKLDALLDELRRVLLDPARRTDVV